MTRFNLIIIVIALISCSVFSVAQQPTVELQSPGGVITTTTEYNERLYVLTNGHDPDVPTLYCLQ